MSDDPSYLKVQWRVAVDWPDYGLRGDLARWQRDPSAAPTALGLRDWLAILDDVATACRGYRSPGRMHFNVGPRETAPDLLWPLFERARAHGLELYLPGRASFLDEDTVSYLERIGVALFNIHFRPFENGPEGDARELEDARRAIALLRRTTIPYRFRFIVHDWNRGALARVLDFVARHEVPRFDLLRALPRRTSSGSREKLTSPREFRELLIATRRAFAEWKADGRAPRLAGQRSEHLWWLLDWERGALAAKKAPRGASHSCSVGKNLLAIRPDGTVWPCSRLPIAIGKVPEHSVAELLASPKLTPFHRPRPSCVGCPVLDRCGGCWAIARAATGDPFGPDPQCWWQRPAGTDRQR